MTDISPGVRATFFGTSTVYLTDGSSHIMIDGFLTRPPLVRVLLGRVAPNPRRIQEILARGGVSALDALFVAHSHYDHVMDSPEVVKQLGGTLHGSESSLNVGRGANLAEERMRVIDDGGQFSFGDFTVRVLEGIHSPGNRYPGTIDKPLATPSKASNYRDGNCYSFHITHPAGTVLIHPSANFVPNKFNGLDVDVLYLGVGILGAQSEQFRDDYWRHVVTPTSPSRIVPVHWDHFGQPLSRNLRALPPVLDKFSVMKAYVERKCAEESIELIVQKAFETLDLFTAPARA
ncbi:MBL fold metallo-hydrolase [Arthrobacter alpinus]|uniref:MBL fold metallo-hydrolase n=1 Tax=Arthrobacter alpinus TaxID=656366 RepID=A0A0S2M3L0_9MICC|nr:MBL fold metallo-hydrolase [Arthrobacter alpinus]ALO68075.1 MBL fold metallo-hydrolase [Arthrobacter alpinus]